MSLDVKLLRFVIAVLKLFVVLPMLLQVRLSGNIGKTLVKIRSKHEKRLKTAFLRGFEGVFHKRKILP